MGIYKLHILSSVFNILKSITLVPPFKFCCVLYLSYSEIQSCSKVFKLINVAEIIIFVLTLDNNNI